MRRRTVGWNAGAIRSLARSCLSETHCHTHEHPVAGSPCIEFALVLAPALALRAHMRGNSSCARIHVSVSPLQWEYRQRRNAGPSRNANNTCHLNAVQLLHVCVVLLVLVHEIVDTSLVPRLLRIQLPRFKISAARRVVAPPVARKRDQKVHASGWLHTCPEDDCWRVQCEFSLLEASIKHSWGGLSSPAFVRTRWDGVDVTVDGELRGPCSVAE